jgi:hypothetical protein
MDTQYLQKTIKGVLILGLLAGGVYLFVRPQSNSRQQATPDLSVVPTTQFPNIQLPENTKPETPVQATYKTFEFIEVTDGCGPYYNGSPCVNVRSGPGTSYASVAKLRNGVVLKVNGSVEADGHTWYKIVFDDWLRYPERASGDWYVASDFVRHFTDNSSTELPAGAKVETKKRILVDRSEQTLYAYDGDTLFMQEKISTGLDGTPTPRGTFRIFRKTPSRYMQGPLPGISDQYYDLPGVPWNLYFTEQGAVIHGAYWHDHFGEQWSHGCVNLPLDKARELYEWTPVGTPVVIRE